jgi:hypothetical protein
VTDKQLERIRERQRDYRARKKARREAEALKKTLALAMNGPLAASGPLAEYLHELNASLLPENPTAQHRQAVELALRAKVRADSLSAWLDGLPIKARLDLRILAVESEARHLRTELRLHLQTLRAIPASKPLTRSAWWDADPEPEPELDPEAEEAPADEPGIAPTSAQEPAQADVSPDAEPPPVSF